MRSHANIYNIYVDRTISDRKSTNSTNGTNNGNTETALNNFWKLLLQKQISTSENANDTNYDRYDSRYSRYITDGSRYNMNPSNYNIHNGDYINNALDSIGPNAPDEVKDAWNKAEEETGVNGLGMSASGKLSHLSSMFTMQLQNQLSGRGSDLLGDSKESAIRAAQEALHRLENPIDISYRDPINDPDEAAFYKAFIKNLGGE